MIYRLLRKGYIALRHVVAISFLQNDNDGDIVV